MLVITNLKKCLVSVLSLNIANSLADTYIPWSQNQFYDQIQGCNGFEGFTADELVDGFNVKVFE